ncbi:hypothetical protein, partial [Palaeococcus sp. (in: euryarchaeotes)]
NQLISEKAKEVEALFKGRSFSRLTNPDEFTLLINIERLWKKYPRVYVVELDDGTSRWFYLIPSEERIRFERKDKFIVFIPKSEEALEKIVHRIINKGAKQKTPIEKALNLIQALLGVVGLFLAYLHRADIMQISNILTFIFAMIIVVQSLKKSYREREYEFD